jgi:hypothetical protein
MRDLRTRAIFFCFHPAKTEVAFVRVALATVMIQCISIGVTCGIIVGVPDPSPSKAVARATTATLITVFRSEEVAVGIET